MKPVTTYSRVKGKDGKFYCFQSTDWDGDGPIPANKRTRIRASQFSMLARFKSAFDKKYEGRTLVQFKIPEDQLPDRKKGCAPIILLLLSLAAVIGFCYF